MRISDWSSDVCSSDLLHPPNLREQGFCQPFRHYRQKGAFITENRRIRVDCGGDFFAALRQRHRFPLAHRYELEAMREGDRPVQPGFDTHLNIGSAQLAAKDCVDLIAAFLRADCMRQERSEEHTSELQSLMRISYAVFCLK